jgi:predicted RNase H-like nuclease (RuvC/YqgF family)
LQLYLVSDRELVGLGQAHNQEVDMAGFDEAELEGVRSQRDLLGAELIEARRTIGRLYEMIDGLKVDIERLNLDIAIEKRKLKYYQVIKKRSGRRRRELNTLNKHCQYLQLQLNNVVQRNISLSKQLSEMLKDRGILK